MGDTNLSVNQSQAGDKVVVSDLTSSDLSLFQRRIEFHKARKTFTGFTNRGGNFRLETLNPNTSYLQKHDPKPTIGGNGKKVDGPDENGLDPELSSGITFRRIVSIYISLKLFPFY